MNVGVTKSDFIYFQNEILKDLKDLELKFNEKIDEMLKSFDSNKSSSTSDISKLYKLYSSLSEKISFSEENAKFTNQLNTFQKKLEDISLNSKIRNNSLEKEINNMTIKYDKIFISSLVVPGLVGVSCPFPNLSNFIEDAHKKLNDLLAAKKKQGIDLKTYKDRLESIIGVFDKRVNSIEEQFKEYCNICFKNYDKNSNDRFNALEEKMNSLRMENIKYSSELIERSNELKLDWDKILDIKTEIYAKLDSELMKFKEINNDLVKIFESQKSEFTLLKKRFTELSEFIKDVRFRNNITSLNNNQFNNNNNNNNSNNNNNKNNNATNSFSQLSNFQKKMKFKNMSKRINFRLKQKLDDSSKSNKSNKSNKDLNKFVDFEPKKENSDNYSPAKTEFNFNINDSEISEIKKETKENETNLEVKDKEKKDYIINKPLHLENVDSTLKSYFNANKGYRGSIHKSHRQSQVYPVIKIHTEENEKHDIKLGDKKNKSFINKENINEFSGEEEKITSIINKKDEPNKKEIINDNSKALNILSETSKEKNIKTSETVKTEKENFKLNSFARKRKMSETITEDNKHKKFLSLNYKTDKKSPNIHISNKQNKTLTKDKIPVKIDSIISDRGIFSKEKDINDKIIAKSKFSFLTNINNDKESSKNDINQIKTKNTFSDKNINIGEENMNLDFAILNKKIIKTNNRLTELYMNSDQKINKIYQYVKTVFDHFSGIFFFKDLYNQKFSFDLYPKTLITKSDFSAEFPTQKNNKTKITLKGKNKIFSANNIKKKMTYKTIVDKIEPFLIKKFKD